MSDNPPADNRRGSARLKPKATAKIICLTGKFGMGPNVAVSLLDVSETGVRMILKTPLTPGSEVEVGLEAPGDRRPTTIEGEVVWCVPMADGNFCLGVRLRKAIPYAVFTSLAHRT